VAVTVRLFAAARAAAGVSEVSVDSASAQEIVNELIAAHPGLAQVLTKCSYLLDEVALHDLALTIEDGSTLDVLPPFAGG
jgi:molybdopterin converting factor small subunit